MQRMYILNCRVPDGTDFMGNNRYVNIGVLSPLPVERGHFVQAVKRWTNFSTPLSAEVHQCEKAGPSILSATFEASFK